MDVEILLDTAEATAENLEQIDRRFREWYAEGAEIRPNKKSFGKLTELEGERRYLMDLGYVDVLQAFRDLHSRLHRLGCKVFIHFIP
jgi:hypothetical protein